MSHKKCVHLIPENTCSICTGTGRIVDASGERTWKRGLAQGGSDVKESGSDPEEPKPLTGYF